MSIVIELDEKLVAEIDAVAKDFNKNRLQYINESLQKSLQDDFLQKKRSDAEKVKRFVESYKKMPQQPEEYEIWQDEQVWEDE
jgi:metal-responsive CopG/Arc/MetJ family transcriptional regulator